MRRFAVFLLFLVLASCAGNEHKAAEENIPVIALGKSANPTAFNLPFDTLLNNYYGLKDGLVDEKDSETINTWARALMVSVDSLPVTKLKADSTLINTITAHTLSISSELKGLIGEAGMEEKRKEFQIVSDQLYDLIRAVQYDRTIIYHVYCATAFTDQGAYWLSKTRQIRNPYIPKKMIGCGEIKDSIYFIRQ